MVQETEEKFKDGVMKIQQGNRKRDILPSYINIYIREKVFRKKKARRISIYHK
jgi:hypothetical protein